MRASVAAVIVTAFAATIVAPPTDAGAAHSATVSGDHRWFHAVSSNGRYLVDQFGDPIPLFWDHQWNLIARAGEWNETGVGTTTPQSVFEGYCAVQAANGFNGVLTLAITSDQGGEAGPYTDGRTWDGVQPWGAGGVGDLNPPYWDRVDALVDACAADGVTVVLNLVSSYTTVAGTAFATLNSTNAATYGNAIGNRYKDKPNLIYQLGVDYFANNEPAFAAIVHGIRATGDTHLITTQYMAESNSRSTSNDVPTGPLGASADISYDEVYSYNASYVETERDYRLSSPSVRPTIFANGHYDQSSTATTFDWHLMADNLGWGLTSGAKGFFYGSEDTWEWNATAYAKLPDLTFPNGPWRATISWFTALAGWWDLVPDFGSTFITSPRGTKLPALAPGGNGGEYDNADPQNNYLTGAVTPDGTLALLYTPVARTITIDGAKMVSQYTAKWVDPYNGAVVAAAPSTTSYPTPGANSHGDTNWYLVLQAGKAPSAPPSPTPPPAPVTYQAKADLGAHSWTKRATVARLRARFVITYACSACGAPNRPITIQGRLANGSWRTISTQSYQHSEHLKVKVPYKFRKVRVRAPVIKTNVSTTYAKVVSNTIPVPKKPK
jgi:hypothetical protein